MRIEDFCEKLNLGKKEQFIIEPFYQIVLENINDFDDFIEHDFIDKYYPLGNAATDVVEYLHRIVDKCKENFALKLYTCIIHYATFRANNSQNILQLPLLDDVLKDDAGALHILVAISAMPLIAETYKKKQIPEKYIFEAYKWLAGPIEIFRTSHNGIPGYTLSTLGWPRHFIDGKLFRIGRFEYLMHPVREFLPAIYQNKNTKELVALCLSDWELNCNGEIVNYGDFKDTAVMTTTLSYIDNHVVGTEVSPLGYALIENTRTICLDEYEAVVSPWQCVPSVHIPSGGGMTLELIKESFYQAVEFFKSYLNEDLKMFSCSSWILNPSWEEEIPNSNMAKFIKQLFLTPSIITDDKDGLYFIFGRKDKFDKNTFPKDNTMRKAFHSLKSKNIPLKRGGMFYLVEDLDKFGQEYYRKK